MTEEYTESELSRLRGLLNHALNPEAADGEADNAYRLAFRMVKKKKKNPFTFDTSNKGTTPSGINSDGAKWNGSFTVPASWLNCFLTNLSEAAFVCGVNYKLKIGPADPEDTRIVSNQKIEVEAMNGDIHRLGQLASAIVETINEQINKPNDDAKKAFADALGELAEALKTKAEKTEKAAKKAEKKKKGKWWGHIFDD